MITTNRRAADRLPRITWLADRAGLRIEGELDHSTLSTLKRVLASMASGAAADAAPVPAHRLGSGAWPPAAGAVLRLIPFERRGLGQGSGAERIGVGAVGHQLLDLVGLGIQLSVHPAQMSQLRLHPGRGDLDALRRHRGEPVGGALPA